MMYACLTAKKNNKHVKSISGNVHGNDMAAVSMKRCMNTKAFWMADGVKQTDAGCLDNKFLLISSVCQSAEC